MYSQTACRVGARSRSCVDELLCGGSGEDSGAEKWSGERPGAGPSGVARPGGGAEIPVCVRSAVMSGNWSPWLRDPLHAASRVWRVDLTPRERAEVRITVRGS